MESDEIKKIISGHYKKLRRKKVAKPKVIFLKDKSRQEEPVKEYKRQKLKTRSKGVSLSNKFLQNIDKALIKSGLLYYTTHQFKKKTSLKKVIENLRLNYFSDNLLDIGVSHSEKLLLWSIRNYLKFQELYPNFIMPKESWSPYTIENFLNNHVEMIQYFKKNILKITAVNSQSTEIPVTGKRKKLLDKYTLELDNSIPFQNPKE